MFECHCPPAASVLASESKWPPLLTTWVNYREQHFDNSCFRSISAACVANKYPIVLAVFPTIMHDGSRTQWYWTTPLWQRLAGSKLLSLCKQHESGSGAEDVTEWVFYFVTFLQDLIDSDLPKAVQLFRSLTEQVRTSWNQTASFTLILLLFSKRSHSDHMLVDAQFLGLFSRTLARHLAVTVAPLSHDNCCQSDFLLWPFFIIIIVLRGVYFRSFLCRWPRLRVMSGSCSPELKAERSRHQRYEAAAFQIPIRARRPSEPSDPS